VSGPVHHAAAAGFGAAADAYERGRPDFPADAVAFLVETLDLRPGRTVLDLGAGTGKLTRMLVPSGARVLALEPVEAMRVALGQLVPDAEPVAGVAEAIPLADGTIDAAVAAQAFHWFDAPAAIAELHRVLTPGGSVALVWNVRDQRTPWVAGMTRIIEPYRGDTPAHATQAWRAAFEATALFSPLELRSFPHEQRLTVEGAVDRVLSISFIAELGEADRASVADEIRALLASDPETAGSDEVILPYRTDVWRCRRLP
jgi:SAM-dependent methyltransferase